MRGNLSKKFYRVNFFWNKTFDFSPNPPLIFNHSRWSSDQARAHCVSYFDRIRVQKSERNTNKIRFSRKV